MKRAALVISILTLAAPCADASWIMQQCNGDQNTTYISAGAGSTTVAAAMGYINTGSTTEILYSHTADGEGWVEGGFAFYGSAVGFADATVGYMGGLLGKVWRTIDGGATWTEIPDAMVGGGTMADSEVVADVAVSDDGATVWIVGENGRCSHSEDGGATWTKVDAMLPAGEGLVVTAAAIRGESIWLVGGRPMAAPVEEPPTPGSPASDGFVLRSDDGGGSFEEIAGDLEHELTGVSFVNPDEGWASAAKYTEGGAAIGVTTDGGETWDFVQPPDLPEDEIVGSAMGVSGVLAGCRGVRFFGRLVGVAYCTTETFEGDGSTGLFLTEDGGETWTPQVGYKAAFSMAIAAANTIFDMAAPDCTRAWLVGEGKIIARWDNDDESIDCEAGGAPSDDPPTGDGDEDARGGGGCGCASAGGAEVPGSSLLSALF